MSSTIGGKKRENTGSDYAKKIGLFEAKVICVNPTMEEYDNILGIELKEDSKAVEYLGESKEGNTYLRLDFWLEEVKNADRFKVSFFLEDKERENKDGTKKQYINNVGTCTWAADENDLPEWFTKREYRVAKIGEEELYNFMRTWLGDLDYRDVETVLSIEWKKLMRGNVKDIKDQIDGEFSTNVIALATIISREKDGEIKEYQGVYNKAFLPAYVMKQFRLIDYDSPKTIQQLSAKKPKDLKIHEKFALTVSGEYGCKDFYVLKDLKEYSAEDNIAASDKTIEEDDADY
jgi:hypothetical protein